MRKKGSYLLIIFIVLFSAALVNNLYKQNISKENKAVLGTTSDLDTILKQAIDSINQYGWDPSINGYHINWYRDNPTTYQNTGHDGQNELRMYQAMVGYKYLHPQDTSLDASIQRVLPLFQSEWQKSTSDKGWIYFTFLRLREYTKDTTTWDTTMQHWAASIYNAIPSDTGVPHGQVAESTATNAPVCPDGYRVDQQFENGLALVDAGKRYNHPEWSQAGAKEVQVITNEAFNTTYNLFNKIMCQGKPWDVEARNGEMGQEAEALLYAGSYTNNQQYLSFAQKILDTIANPATGLIDQQYGGLFFKITMDTGTIDTSKKVTQQYHILFAFHLAEVLETIATP